jgi:stress response protein SCP2
MTATLSKGENVGLVAAGLTSGTVTVSLQWQPAGGVDADCSALLLAAATGKVRSDDDFIFFNQPSGGGGSVAHTGKSAGPTGSVDTLRVELGSVPADIDRLVVAASSDGGTFGQLGSLSVTLLDPGTGADVVFSVGDATTQTAMVFLELYLRGGVWKAKAVGQGYDTGLGGLATDFGVSVEDTPAPAAPVQPVAPPEPAAAPISLEKKRLISLEKTLADSNPKMLSLVKTAGVSLEKRGLGEHTARVALCLDISASMHGLYKDGAIDRLVQRVLALGLRFDDDGAVDVWLFGKEGYAVEPISLANLDRYVSDMLSAHRLEGATYYGKAMVLLRRFYFGDAIPRSTPLANAVPVYVNFVTDGEPNDRREAETQVRESAYEPIFWQFMGVGKRFPFLEKLDDLSGRYVDNADFFSVTENELMGRNPIPDEQLYERLTKEYPSWLQQARAKGLLTS